MFTRKPVLLIGNPYGGVHYMSKVPHLPTADDVIRARDQHVEFCNVLYNLQREQGLYFAQEHVEASGIWELPSTKEVLRNTDVLRVK